MFRRSKSRKARSYRRALRDYLRKESAEIRKLEIRSRGLRLYAAWASGVSNAIQTGPEDWPDCFQRSFSVYIGRAIAQRLRQRAASE